MVGMGVCRRSPSRVAVGKDVPHTAGSGSARRGILSWCVPKIELFTSREDAEYGSGIRV